MTPALPGLDLRHLATLTDDTGIVQHAIFTVPCLAEGYTTDDNARALIASVMLESQRGLGADPKRLAVRYLAFLNYAFNQREGRFRNFMSFNRTWHEEVGSEDAHGRALWSLGTVVGLSEDSNHRRLARQLMAWALPAVTDFSSPRAWAFTILGLEPYLRRYSDDAHTRRVLNDLGSRLDKLYESQSSPEWPWFEPILSYCNAKLPHALMVAGVSAQRQDWIDLGLRTLSWLVAEQTDGQRMSLVGSNGFYPRGGVKATFDQQPVEAHAQLSACLAAYRFTGQVTWLGHAQRTFEWFLGANDLGLAVYDPLTGGCRDGLHPDRVNQNQGAESTLAFLLSFLELSQAVRLAPLSPLSLGPGTTSLKPLHQ